MQNAESNSSVIVHNSYRLMLVNTTSNTGIPSPTSPSAQAPTDTPTATATQTHYA